MNITRTYVDKTLKQLFWQRNYFDSYRDDWRI